MLRRLAIPFETVGPQVDETPLPLETPSDTALRLAIAKAQSVATMGSNALVIGSDQVADLKGTVIGKPKTHTKAIEQLQLMRGKSLVFHTGLALIDCLSKRVQSCVVPTVVTFRQLSDAEIEHYLRHENALDCAGSAKSESLGIALMASMQSNDPTALIGLPLIALCGMLQIEHYRVLE